MQSKHEVGSFKEEMKAFAKELTERGETLLKGSFKKFFDKYPYVGAISWTQYTQYFNDGDTCHFRVHDFNLHIRSEKEEGEGYEQDDGEEIDMYGGDGDNYPYVTQECFDDLSDLESGCNYIEDVLHTVFGDHSRIVATPTGFKVSPYEDHD